MTPPETARIVRARLAAEMADDAATLDRLAAAVARLQIPGGDERVEWMRGLALAFEVERYYTAVEAVLARVLRTMDGEAPTGPGSHQELLRAAGLAVAEVRPAIVPQGAAEDLRELLKFRHLARHGYEVEPDLARMVEHAERVTRVHPRLTAGLAAFARWLAGKD